MTEKQKRFCEEYLIDLNATQAAIRAGYSERTANRIAAENLSKPDIKAYIDEQLAKIHSDATADAQEIMEYLTAVLRGENRSHVLAFAGDGVQRVIEKPPDEKEKLHAAELLGKRYQLFSDKPQEQTGDPAALDRLYKALEGNDHAD